jgi:sugar phosphate isomerase/epimerase
MIFHDFGMDAASLAGSLESRLAAIRRAGFSQVMISAADIVGHPAGVAGGARAVRDSGLRVTGLETLRDFEGLSGRLRAYKVDVAKSMLEVCGALCGRLLLVEASTSTHADASSDAVVRDLRLLATLAIPMGIRIAFKGVSWSRTVTDFVAAGDLVFRANCPNLGLAIDAFDVLAARIPLGELEAIDPQQIYLVQLSDFMWQQIRSVEEETATATHFRVFPGEGAHSDDLAQFVSKLDAIGYCGDYSFDACNDDYRQMPAETVVERSRRAAEWLAETVLRRALPVPNMERLLHRSHG